MGSQRRIALIAGLSALVVAFGAAVFASGAQAFPPNGGSETGEVTVPAGGTGGIHTDNLPPKVDQGTIDMENQEASTGDTLINVAFVLADIPTPGKRFVACAMMTYGKTPPEAIVTLTQGDPSLQLLFFAICIRIAQALRPPPVAADLARASGPQCSEQRTAVPIKITRTRGGYQGVVNGSTFTPRTRSKVIVTCRRTRRGGLLITVKPRKRGQTLRQAVGPTLGVGFVNRGTKPAPIRVTFTAK